VLPGHAAHISCVRHGWKHACADVQLNLTPHCHSHLHVSCLVDGRFTVCTRQVIGELQTLTGKPIARSSRPCVFYPESRLHRLVRSAIPSFP